MGITNFNKWIEQNYPQIIKKINYREYDNVFIDLNPILHVSINKAKSFNELNKRIIWLTDEVLKHIHPKKRLIFSTDGIPSFAKMILQRERRINMVKNLEIKSPDNFISPIIFTPGTKFMNNLPNFLKDYFEKIKNKFDNIELIDLTNLEYGESEFKLFNKMKEIIKLNNQESNILVSNDADVIIMALSQTKDCEIYIGNSGKIFREISLNKFLDSLNKNNNYSNLDYTFLLLLLGNDYLPKLSFIRIEKIIEIYQKIKNIYKEDLIIKKNNRLTVNNNFFAKIIYQFFFNNKKFKSKKLDELNFKKMENYMEGLVWCINDYYKAKNDNMFYMFNYKKNGIDPAELYYYLKIKNKQEIYYPKPKVKTIVNRKIYPAIVMPYKIKFLVKNEYPDKIIDKFKEYYAEELCETCSNYHKQLSNLCCSRKFLEDTNDDSSINLEKIKTIKSSIVKNTKELGSHKKKTHKRLSYDKYIEIIDYLNEI